METFKFIRPGNIVCFCVLLLSVRTLFSTAQAQPRWLRDVVDSVAIRSVDREASTLTLLHAINVKFSQKGKADIHIRIVTKVLQQSGVDIVDLEETTSEDREMKGLDGWIISSNGNVVDLSDENVIEVSTSGIAGDYHDRKTVRASFPKAKPGDIVAYEYEIRDQEPYSAFQAFRVQHQQPARNVCLEIEVPDQWSLHTSTWRMDIFRFQQSNEHYTWIAADLPYEPREPLTPSQDYLAREIHVAAYTSAGTEGPQFTNWETVAQWWTPKLESGVIVDPDVKETTRNLVATITGQADQIRAIARFVSTDIRYVALEIGMGRWEPREAPSTLRNRYGDCKDKTTLMRAMLRSINIPSTAVLLNTRIVIDSDVPTPFLFNHCIVGVPSRFVQNQTDTLMASTDGWVLFDPTNMVTPFGSIAPALQGNSALVVQDSSAKLVRIPTMAPEFNTVRFRGNFKLDHDGSMTGKVTVTHLGMAAMDERYQNRTMDKQKLHDNWISSVQSILKGASVTAVHIVDLSDSIQTSFDVSAREFLAPTGSAYLLKVNPFNSIDVSPFTKETRSHPIWFGEPHVLDMLAVWTLPQRWKAQLDVPRVHSTCSTSEVSCSVSFNDSAIIYKCIDRQTGGTLPAKEYAAARKYRSDLCTSRNMTLFVSKP